MPDVQVVIGGRLVASQRWSIGFCMQMIGGSTPPPDTAMAALANQLYADYVATAWAATQGGGLALSTLVGSRGNLDSVRVYFHASPAADAGVIGQSTTASTAGSGSVSSPPQIAIVATLRTGIAGRRNRGRVYVPGSAGTDSNGNATTATIQGVSLSIANFLSLAATRPLNGGTLRPVVRSATGGYYTPISAVTVDNVLDTQRRRRENIIATITASNSVTIP